jgi:hypothetical protein
VTPSLAGYTFTPANRTYTDVLADQASQDYTAVFNVPTATAATTITAASFTANWNAMAGATGYRLDVATDAAFTAFVTGYNDLDVGNVTSLAVNSNLTVNTAYYYRLRAYNAIETSGNSNTVTVTTQAVPPTVTTAAVSDITSSSATGGGNVTASGGATVTARGVCWSTSPNPTVSGSHTANGTGTGAFTASIAGLAENTMYYVRAYAVNSRGTAYGSQVSFTTDAESVSVTITNPGDGENVSGTVTVTAAASSSPASKTADDSIQVVSKVEFFIDDEKTAEFTAAPYQYEWDTTTVENGSHRIEAVATDAANRTSRDEVTVTVSNGTPQDPAEITLNRAHLNFGAIVGSVQTGTQTILIDNTGEAALHWSAGADAAWLSVSPASGTNSGQVTVSVNPAGLAAGTYNGTVTVEDPGASNSPQVVTVRLDIYDTGTTTLPFGLFETPTGGSTVMSSVPVTGWALDDIEVSEVKIYRSPRAGEGSALIYIGDAVFVDGARPDVEQSFPTYPFNYRAGWGYMLLTNFLPDQGNGTFTLHAKATDREGNEVLLGSKTITCDNANAVKPFGAVDTPDQGGEASGGGYLNYGWVLTPQPNTVPVDGSTIEVWVDGVSLGNPVYNLYREDIAALFPGYNNSNGAVGYFNLDTTAYANGVHTIAWTAGDDAGNTDGIGSRYFTIVNVTGAARERASSGSGVLRRMPVSGSPVFVKKGFGPDAVREAVYPGNDGVVVVSLREDERVEIGLNSEGVETRGDYRYTGNLLFDAFVRPLPVGSTLDQWDGVFSWQPGPAFFGDFMLAFVEKDRAGNSVKKQVKIVISTKY